MGREKKVVKCVLDDLLEIDEGLPSFGPLWSDQKCFDTSLTIEPRFSRVLFRVKGPHCGYRKLRSKILQNSFYQVGGL